MGGKGEERGVEGGGEGRGMGTTSFWTLPPPLGLEPAAWFP